jgi:hypothetical protein
VLTALYNALFRPSTPDRAVLAAINAAMPRSPRWSSLRKAIILRDKSCAACGSKKDLTVHHIVPFHLRPDLELVEDNLIVLCEGPVVNCHFLYGHALDWRAYNPEVVTVAAMTLGLIRTRRYSL